MNIWIFNHYATLPDEPATRSYDIGKELVKKGHKVTIFASSFSHYKFREKILQPKEKWRVEEYDGVRFIWLRTYPYKGNDWRRALNMMSYAWQAFRMGRGLKEKPDVIIGTCVHPAAAFSAYVTSVCKNSRFFFEVTDLWPQTLVDMGVLSEKNPVTWCLRCLEKFLYQKAERIIVLLPHADKYITCLGIPRDKIIWTPIGVDLSQYEDIKTYDGGISEVFTIMYLGGHAKYHGLEVVLEAANILQNEAKSNVRFILVGDGPEKPNLIMLSQNLNLHNIEFRDMVPKYEATKLIGEADALIQCFKALDLLKYGVSPLKIFDYLPSGRPILCAMRGSNNPVEEAKAGITIPPENPQALAQAVTELIAMPPEERIQMGKNGLEYMKKYHDIRILTDKLESIIVIG